MKEKLLNQKEYKLYDFVKIHMSICPFYTLVLLLNNIISYLQPSIKVILSAGFIDAAIGIYDGGQKKIIYIYIVLIVLLIAYGYLNYEILGYIRLKRNIKIKKLFMEEIIEKRAKLKYCYIENDDTWALINRTCKNADERIIEGFNSINNSVGLFINIVSLLAILMSHIWWVGLIIVAVSVPLIKIAIKAGKENYDSNVEADKILRRADYLQKILTNKECAEERNLFGYSSEINEVWYKQFEKARKINKKTKIVNYIRMKSGSIITMLIAIFIISILLIPICMNRMSIGIYISLVSAVLVLVQDMSWTLTNNMMNIAKSKEYLKDLSEFNNLDEQEGAIDVSEKKENVTFESIEFRCVSFAYPGTEHYVLKDCSFMLKKGVHYAFVGVNGSGKTTITKLLLGLYDNYTGEILINGKNLNEYSLSYLKALYAVVFQDFCKYSIPVKDNIMLGNVLEMENCNNQNIYGILSSLGMREKIEKLPQELSTWLGKIKENGYDMSGGEWQRIAISRALYHDAPLYILDEPTAALDPMAESEIYEVFSRISINKSTIFITHRLGAAKIADEIIVISEGRVLEIGTHDELLKKNGLYSEMFNEQRSWYV